MLTYSDEKHFDVDPNQIVVDARSFASWRQGLPEWIKNSSDAYERAMKPAAERIIFVLFAPSTLIGDPMLACLDFVGMTSSDLTGKLTRYGDPKAAGIGTHIGGGHGNGGKLFAVGGFKKGAIWRTVKDGLRNEYGLAAANKPELAFALDKGGEEIRDRKCGDLTAALDEWLSELGLSLSDLPAVVNAAAKTASGCTFVVGLCPEHSSQPMGGSILDALRGHPQCRVALETTTMFVVAGKKLLNGGNPLTLEEIEPYEGFEEPRVVSIPSVLKDPIDQSEVPTVIEGSQGELKLWTSDKQMPATKSLQGRHTIDYKQDSKIRGSRPVRERVGKGTFTDRVYGECQLDALTENYESQTRGPLVDAPLVRALEQWTSEQIVAYAAEIEQASTVHEKAAKDEERVRRLVQQMNKLNNWINRIVDEISVGAGSDEDVEGGGKPHAFTRVPLPIAPVGRIGIAMDGRVAGTKVPLEFTTEFFGTDGITRVRPVHVTWYSSVPSVAAYSTLTGMINTYQPGTTMIWCESDAAIDSNRIELQVVACASIELDPGTMEVPIGRRRRILATGVTPTRHRHEGIRVNWNTDSSDVLRVGLAGFITGLSEGTATVTARDGDGTAATCVVTVIPALEGPGGPSRPKYLLSEVQKAPYDTEPPVFHKHSGLVTQRQVDIETQCLVDQPRQSR